MKVILEIDEAYAGVLTVTAVGTSGWQTRVSTQSVDLSQHNHLTLGADGRWTNERIAEDGKAD